MARDETGGWLTTLRAWARALKQHIQLCLLAVGHPQAGWPARLVLGLTLAYALSPIDLIPDLVPVLGQVDDLLLVPLGIWLAIRLLPAAVLVDCRQRVATGDTVVAGRGYRIAGLLAVVGLWLASCWLVFVLITR